MSTQDIVKIKNQLLSLEKAAIDHFINALLQSLSRRVAGVTVTVLHGQLQQIATIEQAIEYIQNYQESQPSPAPALKYEIDIRYNNGDVIHAVFQNKAKAINFLRTFA